MKPKTQRKTGGVKGVVSSNLFSGKGYTLGFPPIEGGWCCCRADKGSWTFKTLTTVRGETRHYIGHVTKHGESWNEVTKATFLKAQKTLRARCR